MSISDEHSTHQPSAPTSNTIPLLFGLGGGILSVLVIHISEALFAGAFGGRDMAILTASLMGMVFVCWLWISSEIGWRRIRKIERENEENLIRLQAKLDRLRQSSS